MADNQPGNKQGKKKRRGKSRGGGNKNFLNPVQGQNPKDQPKNCPIGQSVVVTQPNDNEPGPSNQNPVPESLKMGDQQRSNHKKEDFMILQKLKQLVGSAEEVKQTPQEKIKFSNRNRLYVGNLTDDVTENDLKEMFAPYGEIAETFINKEKSFAFVKVDYRPNAEKAKRELDGVERNGRNLRIRYSPNATCVKVLNLDLEVSTGLLYKTFEIFGPVERAEITVDESGKSTGEGIVEFSRKKSAQSAIRFCDERSLLLSTSLRPAIVEAHDLDADPDGFPKITSKDPKAIARMKQMRDKFRKKKEAMKRELMKEIAKIDALVEQSRKDRDRQKSESEKRERQQQENTILMQAQHLSSNLGQFLTTSNFGEESQRYNYEQQDLQHTHVQHIHEGGSCSGGNFQCGESGGPMHNMSRKCDRMEEDHKFQNKRRRF